MRPSGVILGLLRVAAVTSIVGERIYPNIAPAGSENSGPFIVYRLTSTAREKHLKGTSGILARGYEVVCCTRDYDQSEALAEVVIAALESWRGAEGDLQVRRVSIDDEADDDDRPEDGSDAVLHIRRIQITVDHLAATTSIPAGS